jgi:hypothetical protein
VKIVPCQAWLEIQYGKALRGTAKQNAQILMWINHSNGKLAALWMENLYVETHSGGKMAGQVSDRTIY